MSYAAAVVVYFVDWNRESWHPREALLALILMTRAFFQGPKGHKERGRLSPAYQFTASQLLCQRWLHSPKNTAIDGTHTIHFCDVTEAKKPTLKFLSFFLNISLNLISHRSLIFGSFPPLDFFFYWSVMNCFTSAWDIFYRVSVVCIDDGSQIVLIESRLPLPRLIQLQHILVFPPFLCHGYMYRSVASNWFNSLL